MIVLGLSGLPHAQEHLLRTHPRAVVEGIVHADDSARIQTVRDDLAPAFARLLREVTARTGAGVVVNTSFDVEGQP